MNFRYLIPSGLSKISKIETTSKVSLKFTIRINLGRRGAHAPNSRLWTQPASPPPPPTAREELSPGQKGPIAPIGTINNIPRPQKKPQIAITDHVQNLNHN